MPVTTGSLHFFSDASTPAPVTASHGLIWPGSADASTALSATARPELSSPGLTPIPRGHKKLPSAPSSTGVSGLTAASADRPGLAITIEAATGAGSKT
ncbi:hypothetical protein [uncultured Roseobacter sp.]|uniref:hypothetical protein n=1 Tax=uncultured Roseobacter sp. TaxID=114847 RepID=UPI0026369467|nr:hypothetical protein [uncultured Roseobacter sp.]